MYAQTGVTIAHIKDYIELRHEGDDTLKQIYEIFKTKRNLITAKRGIGNIEMINYKINLYSEN
ncbi:MAG: hypothetical protein ACLTAI_13535 [Thomasclavelia sp.]